MATINIGLADYPVPKINISKTGWMLNATAKWTANTGMNTISTANTGLDGGGTLKTLLTAASSGTFVKTITVKSATGNTSYGMVRIFIYDGTNTRLFMEIDVDPVTSSRGTTY